MTNELKIYDIYRYNCDIKDCAEVLQDLAYGKCDQDITKEISDALYQLDAIAQNPYNSDYYRIFYNVLLQATENHIEDHRQLIAYDIKWDTDGADVGLADTMEIPEGITDYDEISDFLSEMTGYCHFGFELR